MKDQVIIHAAICSFSTNKNTRFWANFEGQYQMDDSYFQVALIQVTFVLFQNRKNVVFSHTKKS